MDALTSYHILVYCNQSDGIHKLLTESLMPIVLILAVAVLVILDLAALQWGADSRDWDKTRADQEEFAWSDAGHRA
jgi:hypothetical protein